MRILYITMDNPAVETILGGMHDETLSGLPAFYYPFKLLLERGCTIDLLLYSLEPKTVVESAHFRRENLSRSGRGTAVRSVRWSAAASGARDAPMPARAAL